MPGSEQDFTVNVGDRVFFVEDQSTLTPEAQETLRRQAAWLQKYPAVMVQVEGHADERGTREYNIALSARRATATREFLIAQGVEATRISSIAYGKERPAALCDAEQCWSQNRRAVTVITGGAKTELGRVPARTGEGMLTLLRQSARSCISRRSRADEVCGRQRGPWDKGVGSMISRLASFKIGGGLPAAFWHWPPARRRTRRPRSRHRPGRQRAGLRAGLHRQCRRPHLLPRKTSRRLPPEAQETLRRQAALAAASIRSVTVQVEGHADERGTREYNIALSARRATAAREFLIAQGVTGNRISSIAYGKERPVGAVRCRTVLVAEPPCRDRHHRWCEVADRCLTLHARSAAHSLNFTVIAVQLPRLTRTMARASPGPYGADHAEVREDSAAAVALLGIGLIVAGHGADRPPKWRCACSSSKSRSACSSARSRS